MANKKGAIVVGIVSLLFVGTAIFFVIKGINANKKAQRNKKSDDKKVDGKNDATTSTTSTDDTKIDDKKVETKKSYTFPTDFVFPIKLNQKNDSVEKLQQLLLKLDSKSLPKFGADKSFGSETETALFKVIGKNSVESQADIEKIKDKIKAKTIGLLTIQNSLASIGLR